MGFFGKLWNFVRGKGFKDDNTDTIIKSQDISEPLVPTYEKKEETTVEQLEEIEQLDVPDKETQLDLFGDKAKVVQKSEAEKEFEEFEQKLKTKPLMKEVVKGINNEGVNNVNVNQNVLDQSDLHPLYTKIFTDNAKLNDPDILNILIENRDKLQHRFEASFKIYSKDGLAGELRVSGILIEHTNGVYGFITEGQEVEYLKEVLDAVQNHFEQNYGAIGGSVGIYTTKKFTVTAIDIDVTYA